MLRELQVEGLVGPTHNYAGLGLGNVASHTHGGSISNPRAAALQSLEKMRWLHEHDVPVAMLPPQHRPRLDVLKSLGFDGSVSEQLQQAREASPTLLRAVWSASSMWSANAATVTPSSDSADGLVHLTPANLLSSLHRVLEHRETAHYVRQLFAHNATFKVHDALNVTTRLADEGAANHMRLWSDSSHIHIFTYGAEPPDSLFPKTHMPRQQRAAGEEIVQQHQLDSHHCLFVQQHPDAIDAGVFHHDVIGMSHRALLIVHERAWLDQDTALDTIRSKAPWLSVRVIKEDELSLQDAVATYFFNAQLVSLADGSTAILFPHECSEHAGAYALAHRLQEELDEVSRIEFLNLRESMKNGGGPACLRLRVPLTEDELGHILPGARFTTKRYHQLQRFIETHYRERVAPDDLLDAAFAEEAHACHSSLLKLLDYIPYS